jgi:hypothetical protein
MVVRVLAVVFAAGSVWASLTLGVPAALAWRRAARPSGPTPPAPAR